MTLEELKQQSNAQARKRPRYLEDRFQMACKRWFDYQFPGLRLLLHHSPNEGLLPSGAAAGAKRKAMGVRAGFPDFVFLKPSRDGKYPYLCIELKTATGRQSEGQKAYQEAVEMVGGCYVVCRSLEEFMATMTNWIMGE